MKNANITDAQGLGPSQLRTPAKKQTVMLARKLRAAIRAAALRTFSKAKTHAKVIKIAVNTAGFAKGPMLPWVFIPGAHEMANV